MDKIKKIFYEQNLTWFKIIVFSIISGVVTGLIPLIKILDNTSIHNIATCYEMWVLLAMFIILNSKKPLEAGLKTFVFFLISQPLCYLVQVPFYRDGFGIFMYYSYWAKLTLLTFPGAIIAWYTKKQNWLSILILSVALVLLSFELCTHFNTLINSFPYQLLAVIFILLEMFLFIKMIFDDKKKRIVLYIISLILLVFASFYTAYTNEASKHPDHVALYFLEKDNEYSIVEKDESVDVDFNQDVLVAKSKECGEYIIKIKDKNNNIIKFSFIVTDGETKLEILDNNH